MATAIEDLAKAVASEQSVHSRLGRWILAVSELLASIAAAPAPAPAPASGGCCVPGVVFGNVGSTSEFIPFPAGCEQPDTNYVVTGVFTGGDLTSAIEFAIAAKATGGFTIGFEPGVPVGGLLMDFVVHRC